jgi:hypothetical protein
MKQMAFFIAAGFFLCGCEVALNPGGYSHSYGNGILVSEVRSVYAFDAVEVHGDIAVRIEEGSYYEATVTVDENLAPYLSTTAYGGRLVVEWSRYSRPSQTPTVVLIAPRVEELRHYGRAKVEVEQSTWRREMLLESSGGGNIEYIGAANRITALARSSGKIELLGYADALEAKTEGSGDIIAETLLAADAFAEIFGSGDITLSLGQGAWLSARIFGSGDVEWWGWPSKTAYELEGSGRIIEHRALAKGANAVALKFKALKPAEK